MPRDITVTFDDGSTHVYRRAPDDITPEQITERAGRDFGRAVASLDGGRKSTTIGQDIKQGAGNLLAGAVRGAGSLGATLLTPYDLLAGNTKSAGNPERRKAMDEALGMMGADTGSLAYGAGKLTTEIAGTMGAGGLAGNALAWVAPMLGRAAPAVNATADAARTAGFAGANMGARTAGGAISGAASAGLVNPDDAALGGAIGGALPGVIKGAGMLGGAVRRTGGAVNPSSGRVLADALGLSQAELQQVIQAAAAAPDNIVPGSRLTLAQALEKVGAGRPEVKMLERIASGGPGGDALLSRYADQATARMEALRANGAQTYMGAPKMEATLTGDKVGAILRTQATDDREAARVAWEALNRRAADEGVALQIPVDTIADAMRPLGRGTVGAGKDAQALAREAQAIGTQELPAVTFGRTAGAKQETLLDAVKRAGGINQDTISSKMLGGEVASLRESGLGRVVYKSRGQSLAKMAEKMREAGFIPDEDPATLIEALKSGGKTTYSSGADMDSMYRELAKRAMGDAPPAGERIPVAVPFEEFQRLRRSAGELSAKPNLSDTEAKVLGDIQRRLTGRVDEAAQGNLLSGEVMPEGFRSQYNAARDMTRTNAERYKGGNNITQILRKPVGQDYTLTGDEITNKLWHGGAGLGGDVRNLLQVLADNNREPAVNALRKFIMTDAAGKATASGNLGSALPRYVESRMPGLREALSDDQLRAVTQVAEDIRNGEAAAAVLGLRGSDTQAKIARALDAGLLDSPIAKTLGRVLSIKGVGAESARNKLAELVVQHKGRTVSQLLADPKAAADALRNAGFVAQLPSESVSALRLAAGRAAPVAYPALARD